MLKPSSTDTAGRRDVALGLVLLVLMLAGYLLPPVLLPPPARYAGLYWWTASPVPYSDAALAVPVAAGVLIALSLASVLRRNGPGRVLALGASLAALAGSAIAVSVMTALALNGLQTRWDVAVCFGCAVCIAGGLYLIWRAWRCESPWNRLLRLLGGFACLSLSATCPFVTALINEFAPGYWVLVPALLLLGYAAVAPLARRGGQIWTG